MRNAAAVIAVMWIGIAIATTLYFVGSVSLFQFRLRRRRRALAGENLIAEMRAQYDDNVKPLRMVGKK
jgi:hypothetical protein